MAVWGVLAAGSLCAESGRDAWLRYEALDETAARPYRAALPAVLAAFGDAPQIASARQEILRGVRGMLGRTLRVEQGLPRENAIVIGTLDALRRGAPALVSGGDLAEDAFRLRTVSSGDVRYTVIAGANPRGALYGAFALLRKIGLDEPIASLDETQTPYAPVRWVNQWDNLDGSIERGYGGRSIFWENGAARADLTRVGEYGAPAGLARHQRLLHQQRERQPEARCPRRFLRRSRASPTPSGRGACAWRSRSISAAREDVGGLDTFDPLRRARRRLVEEQGGRDLQRHPGSRRLRSEGRFGGPRRPLRLRHAPTPTPPTWWPARCSRTAACSSTAASSTTTTWTGAT